MKVKSSFLFPLLCCSLLFRLGWPSSAGPSVGDMHKRTRWLAPRNHCAMRGNVVCLQSFSSHPKFWPQRQEIRVTGMLIKYMSSALLGLWKRLQSMGSLGCWIRDHCFSVGVVLGAGCQRLFLQCCRVGRVSENRAEICRHRRTDSEGQVSFSSKANCLSTARLVILSVFPVYSWVILSLVRVIPQSR